MADWEGSWPTTDEQCNHHLARNKAAYEAALRSGKLHHLEGKYVLFAFGQLERVAEQEETLRTSWPPDCLLWAAISPKYRPKE